MASRQYTRQVATIVSIDAVGFSRLMGMDDEAAVSTFETYCDIIRATCGRHGGRPFGAAGDSMMAEFGLPSGALLAALEFQDAIAAENHALHPTKRLEFRTGINTGHVIVRDESRYGDDVNIAARLQEMAPKGGIVISETTWHHVRGTSSAQFVDLGEQDFHNIILPVHAYGVDRAAKDAAPRQAEDWPNGTAATEGNGSDGPPAIAVLVFRNNSGDGDTQYLSEAIAEDIIMGLSHTRWLPVIAMNSSFQFRDDAMSAQATGRALGARYIVSGSLARQGDSLRIRVSLDDSSTDRNVWARRFDRAFSEILQVQNEIGNEIVAMLEKEVDRVEQMRTFRMPWENQESWQLVRRGRWHMQRRTREDAEIALDLFQRAYERDPNSSAVLNELSWWYFWRAWLNFGQSNDNRADLEKVADYARRSLFVDSQDARPHAHLGITDIMLGRPAAALEHLGEALRINPSFAFARSAMGSAYLLLGDHERAIPMFREADRLSPFDHYRFHNLGELASALFFAGQWDDACAMADRSLELAPSYWYARFVKIAALGRLGRMEEAQAERRILLARYPEFTAEQATWIPFADKCLNGYLIDAFRLSEEA
ncbi:adenylate/guanylate cyclase domain-containing protein [Mesorhizobium xinjiangense]|uniref:adenylate/guanylate cyclase domain-containing protein n=1 Tax=Mesorhizobium xinjiangense TaxID=2678685 RepID=UPI0012EE14D0|nr:adenylate/guanylate cyclase domain-containing protein [Mesorhizobium xinjiangense]